jgi:hypothetical protein
MELINKKIEKESLATKYKKLTVFLSISLASFTLFTPFHYFVDKSNVEFNNATQDTIKNVNSSVKSFHCLEASFNNQYSRTCDIVLKDGKTYHQSFDFSNKLFSNSHLQYTFENNHFSYDLDMNNVYILKSKDMESNLNTVNFDVENINQFISHDTEIKNELNNYNLWNKNNAS